MSFFYIHISPTSFQTFGMSPFFNKKFIIINTIFLMKKIKKFASIPHGLMFYTTKTFYHYANILQFILVNIWNMILKVF
jgi:hypothetical protein